MSAQLGVLKRMILMAMLAGSLTAAPAPAADEFPPESKYDTTVHPDEALGNVRIRNHRWPDCYSLETAIADIFRLEGVADAPDATEAKAMATWKWLLTLMSPSGGRVFEGNPTGPYVRYIPDALAAIGDRSVVPALVKRVKQLRIDYRVHVARALGILGGEQAVKTLKSLAEKDPNISVRGQARRALAKAVQSGTHRRESEE